MKKTIVVAASAATLLFAITAASAQQGTTLAGPAQGSKMNGESSTTPSGESGANGNSPSRRDATSQAPVENEMQKGSNPSANGK